MGFLRALSGRVGGVVRLVRLSKRALAGSRVEVLEARVVLSSYPQHAYNPLVPWQVAPSPSPTTPPKPQAAKPALSHGSPGDPAVVGAWTPPVPFKPAGAQGPYLAIHATLLPNGKVVAWPHDYFYYQTTKHAASYTPNVLLWDPATNAYSATNVTLSNLFCSGHAFLADGRLVVLGGHGPASIPVSGLQTGYGNNHTEIYDWRTNSWSNAGNMQLGRYYGSAITLGTGQILAVAGFTEQGYNNPLIELYTVGKGWSILPKANTGAYGEWYPQIYQLSNGLVVSTDPGSKTFLLNPANGGAPTAGPPMNFPRRYYGTSAMYDDNKILAFGGDANPDATGPGSRSQITNTAEVIDFNGKLPAWHPTGSMQFARYYANATVLPDGTVLVTGGTGQQDNPSGNALRGAVYAAEVWSPATGRWTTLASMSVPRLYHSTALLLPDGRVLVAGGGEPESTGEVKGTIHDNMQIFSPPYLFHGPRPTIASAPAAAAYAKTVSVTSRDSASVTQINLVRLGSVTHGFNMTQHLSHLKFSRAADGTLKVTMPGNPNSDPPGYYMLFLLNARGVPSVSRVIQLTP